MSRRTAVLLTAALAATTVSLPAVAAAKKPKPVTVTYKVTLAPDPSLNAATACAALIPAAQDKRTITIPAKGTLTVKLTGASHPGADWDLYTLDAAGDLLSSSEGDSAVESTLDKFKKKTTASIWVCNLVGTPDGTVTYTFTYT